jgi:Papain fold toxin 1, glutamine deamidase
MTRIGRLLLAIVAVLVGVGTTAANATAFVYDGPVIALVGIHAIECAEAGLTQLGVAHEESVSPSTEVLAASTTPHDAVNATEAGSVRNVNPLGGTNNCVNCAVATDATLSGAPSSALNVAPGISGQPISILEDLYGGAFKPVSGQAGIDSILAEAGSGSRGIVFGARGNDVGHVFNAVNQKGTIRFLDGQTGGVASFKGYTDFWFLATG